MNDPARHRHDWVAIAATAFLAANLLHGADHLRQGIGGVDLAVKIGGAVVTAAAIVVFARRRQPQAPLLAAVVGFWSAVLIAQAHIAPHWSIFSDSYLDDVHADALSWAIMLAEVGAALLLGVAGARELRARRWAASRTGWWPQAQ